MAVLFDHMRGLFFEGLQPTVHPSLFAYLFFGATSFGHDAVIVFFVLSGFFVGRSVLKAAPQWSWRLYLSSRLVRLYVVLIPALAVTFAADQVSLRMPLAEKYLFHSVPHFNNLVPMASAMSWFTAIANACYLQTIVAPTFGSNTALWSLANEFWYYVLFPLLILAFLRKRPAARLSYAGAALLVVLWLPKDMTLYFLVWLAGVALNFMREPRRGTVFRKTGQMASFLLFCGCLVLFKALRIPLPWSDFGLAAAFTAWMYFLLVGSETTSRSYGRLAAGLAACSYSIYAIHMPLLMLFRTAVDAPLWVPSAFFVLSGVAMAVATALLGFVLAKGTEAHTDRVRQIVFKLTSTRQERATANSGPAARAAIH